MPWADGEVRVYLKQEEVDKDRKRYIPIKRVRYPEEEEGV
jgi:hypothetical protein